MNLPSDIYRQTNFVAPPGSGSTKVLTCALLSIFFSREFLHHSPRSIAYGWFLDEKMSCVGEYYDYPEEEGWITANKKQVMITIKNVFFQKSGLDQIPGIAALRLQYETFRENSSKIGGRPKAKLTINVTADILDDNKKVITVDEKEGPLSVRIVVQFMLDPTSDTFDQICNWHVVVRLLRGAVDKAFRQNGDFNFKKNGFAHSDAGRIWIDSCQNRGDKEESGKIGLGNPTGYRNPKNAEKTNDLVSDT